MITIGISEARRRLPQLVDEIDARFERVSIMKGSKLKAVLMSAEEFESWMETIEEYKDPESLKRARELNKMSVEEIKKSDKFITLEELKKSLKAT